MNRLQSRVRRLEAAAPIVDDPGLSGVFRTSFDEHGNKIKWECLLDPVKPRILPPRRPPNATPATPPGPAIVKCIDKPWKMTRAQTAIWKRLLSNRSRSVHQIPFTSEQAVEWRCLWEAASAAGGDYSTNE